MAFKKRTRQTIADYVDRHLPHDSFYKSYFWFISDVALKSRLEDEFRAARYIYKLLEGLQVNNGMLVAQCKVQILLYASIYEAVLHHILLNDYATSPEVISLTNYEHKKPINISSNLRAKIQSQYTPQGTIQVFENETRQIDERKIVFEDKAETARKIGLINQEIKDVVCDVYSMRNAIHLHAELRRGVTYDLNAAKKAYWHLQGFTRQIGKKLEEDGKAVRPTSLSTSQQNGKDSWFQRLVRYVSRR
ncbi:hypothetical protein OYT1_ch1724 [Ferriphaselus amnicola]|uniref:Uncharacterized protein n=1 Tax=Ferriphaselus amnicola TaxID=1188319 RepID=A0A2Z6GD56_9PROT|nr:hypothetical protein [Ferriphaselus amnicola]BBE51262.1 hypothetical protein OYT1_ch1724 [Ferriphaselus amnicola]